MNIKLVCIGKIKEKYLVDGIEEYRKRLKLFCELELVELKEVNTDDINKNIELEGDAILNNIKKTDYVVALSIPGKNMFPNGVASRDFIKIRCAIPTAAPTSDESSSNPIPAWRGISRVPLRALPSCFFPFSVRLPSRSRSLPSIAFSVSSPQ